MGELQGNLESQATGKKIANVEEVPADYLANAKKLFPEFIAGPIAVLDSPPKFPS